MTRQLRKTFALTMSLLLGIFTICQAHAMATMAASGQPASAVMTKLSTMSKQHMAAGCHDECQHQQAADLGKKPQLPDAPVALALIQSYPSSPGVSTSLLVGAAADRGQGDPPPRLRFKRLLE